MSTRVGLIGLGAMGAPMARRLVEAGVSTEIHVYPGGCHNFETLAPDADVSKRFTGDIHRALRRALHGI